MALVKTPILDSCPVSSIDKKAISCPAIFALVVLSGVTIIAIAMKVLHVVVGEPRAQVFVLAAMWMPAFARLVATRTADRQWQSPIPLRHWGRPKWIVVVLPLATVTAIYLSAYSLASLAGVPRSPAVWAPHRVAVNVLVNLPLLSLIGAVGALGEEVGWRGYLQPRLDQLHFRFSLLWVIVLETLFHLPLVVLTGYLGAKNLTASIALFFAMGLGLTPLWTWATYRWQTLWMAVLFHTFHNAVSQVIVPKALGEGDPLYLGESGIYPVVCYLIAGLVVFFTLRRRRQTWPGFAHAVVDRT